MRRSYIAITTTTTIHDSRSLSLAATFVQIEPLGRGASVTSSRSLVLSAAKFVCSFLRVAKVEMYSSAVQPPAPFSSSPLLPSTAPPPALLFHPSRHVHRRRDEDDSSSSSGSSSGSKSDEEREKGTAVQVSTY